MLGLVELSDWCALVESLDCLGGLSSASVLPTNSLSVLASLGVCLAKDWG